jgi:purine-nucleoside phosphorylase
MHGFADLTTAARARPPVLACVLGSGLTECMIDFACTVRVAYAEVPGLVAPTVQGHAGEVQYGLWAGQPALVFAGRLHYYEGHPWDRVTASIRLAAELGSRVLLLTNAAGGIRADLTPGRLMAIRQHLCWNQPYFWRIPENNPSPYAPELLEQACRVAEQVGLPWATGVYASLTGPCYETPAEIRALRANGADAVGMSTAKEIEAGAALGLRCMAFSLITNCAAGLSDGPLSHAEVLHNSQANRATIAQFLAALVRQL